MQNVSKPRISMVFDKVKVTASMLCIISKISSFSIHAVWILTGINVHIQWLKGVDFNQEKEVMPLNITHTRMVFLPAQCFS